jgi:predicted ATPase with chaperone activity
MLKIGRTIADLAVADSISSDHCATNLARG